MSHVVTSYQVNYMTFRGYNALPELGAWLQDMSRQGWELKALDSNAVPNHDGDAMELQWFAVMQRPGGISDTRGTISYPQ